MKHPVNKVLVSQLQKEMVAQGLSQHDLAKEAGITPAAVSMILSGTRSPNLDTLMRLCYALQATPNDLLLEPAKKTVDKQELKHLRRRVRLAVDILTSRN